jgi:uncharacterized cupredoxin-like copper-binding protein
MKRSLCAIAGILLAALTHAHAADAPERQDIQVVLTNFSFTPNVMHLQRNVPTTIHLMNSASGGHAFSSPELFGAVTVASEDRAKIIGGKIEVPAGQSVDITVTPNTPGTYPVVCTHFLHQSFGMRGQATIE